MKWLDEFIEKQTPERIAHYFIIMALFQIPIYLLHLYETYFFGQTLGWRNEIKISPYLDFENKWNKRYQFAESVDAYFSKGELCFKYSSFQELLNIYAINFFIVDTLKYVIIFYVFWQLSKVFSQKKDFMGFTTEGVKRMRLAAFPIMLIPILGYISKYIFVLYASTQSTYIGLQKYSVAFIIGGNIAWVYYLYATLSLLGLAQIFKYGQQLKEETDLTV
jgi:Protein of unknown function (DUF2975)